MVVNEECPNQSDSGTSVGAGLALSALRTSGRRVGSRQQSSPRSDRTTRDLDLQTLIPETRTRTQTWTREPGPGPRGGESRRDLDRDRGTAARGARTTR